MGIELQWKNLNGYFKISECCSCSSKYFCAFSLDSQYENANCVKIKDSVWRQQPRKHLVLLSMFTVSGRIFQNLSGKGRLTPFTYSFCMFGSLMFYGLSAPGAVEAVPLCMIFFRVPSSWTAARRPAENNLAWISTDPCMERLFTSSVKTESYLHSGTRKKRSFVTTIHLNPLCFLSHTQVLP